MSFRPKHSLIKYNMARSDTVEIVSVGINIYIKIACPLSEFKLDKYLKN